MHNMSANSALAHRKAPTNTYVDIREIPTRGMIDLRGSAEDKKFTAAVKKVLGLALPTEPRTSKSFGDVKAMWLSPDQWLVTCGHDNVEALTAELSAALTGIHSLAVNVSDMRSIIRLEGEGAREVMMKSGSLDFTNAEYATGYVRRMRFAEIAAMFNIVETNVIDIYVFRSYANYAFDFLIKAARKGSEVGLKV